MATISTFIRIREPVQDAQSGHVKWVRVEGNLTSSSAAVTAAKRLRTACAKATRLIVDAAAVDQADTKFIAILVDLHRRVRKRGGRLVILPSEAVRRWLRICRLEALL